MDLKKLIQRVKESRLMMDDEKKYWIQKMETMRDSDLEKLDDILSREAELDWEEELPKYEQAVEKAEEYLRTVTPSTV